MPRPRKSGTDRHLEGTSDRGHGRGIAPPAVAGSSKDFNPPSHLEAGAKALWRRLAPDLVANGRLGVEDLGVFEMYCRAMDETRRHTKEIERDGWWAENTNGTRSPHALVSVRDKAAKLAADLAKALGLTPVHRSQVKSAEKGVDAPKVDDGSTAGLGARPSPRLVG